MKAGTRRGTTDVEKAIKAVENNRKKTEYGKC